MAKWPNNHNKTWSNEQIKQMKTEIKEDTPTRVMGLKLGRTAGAVQSKANELGLSTKPTNQSPYNRHTKKSS